MESKTIDGITIEPVFCRKWYGQYSTGEWFEDTFSHFTDDGCRKLEAVRGRINILPPLPWEASAEDLAKHQQRLAEYRTVEDAISLRREILANLYQRIGKQIVR